MNGSVLLVSGLVCGLAAQTRPPVLPPGPLPVRAGPPYPERHLEELRQKLKTEPAVNVSAQRALQYAARYLQAAEKALRSGYRPRADRLSAAGQAMMHVAEHQQHLAAGGGPNGPPLPASIEEHLRRVYFRTEQADYFLRQAQDESAAPLPQWARGFYQLGMRAFDRKDWVAADENAKCAEEVVRALENLAQAANMNGSADPPAGPPPGPPAAVGPRRP